MIRFPRYLEAVASRLDEVECGARPDVADHLLDLVDIAKRVGGPL